jgi:hypothetical protein
MFIKLRKSTVALLSKLSTPAGMPLGFSAVAEWVGNTPAQAKWQVTFKRFGRVVHSGLFFVPQSHTAKDVIKMQLRWLVFSAMDEVGTWAEHVANTVPLSEYDNARYMADVREEWEHETRRILQKRAYSAEVLKKLGFNSDAINKIAEAN